MSVRRRTSPTAEPDSITAFVGSDDSAVKAAAREFAARHAPADASEFGLETIDGAVENADQAVERIHAARDALLTLPFLGGSKLVWLKNVTFLAETVTGRAESVQAALEQLAETLAAGLPDGVRFLLSATEVDKRRGFYRKLAKLGRVEVFDRIDTSRAGWEELVADFVQTQIARRGLRFQPEALDLFIARCGADKRVIANELEKLALHAGPELGAVTERAVRELVPDSSSGVIWELGNALARREPTRCLALLDRLLGKGENPVGILLAAIAPTVRNLLAARHLVDRHGLRPTASPWDFARAAERLPPEVLEALPRKKDGTLNGFALGLAATQVHRFSAEELVAALEACLEANLALVTTQVEPRVILSRLLLRMTGLPQKAA